MNDQCHTLAKTFFRMAVRDQLTRFAELSIEDQYTVFICGNQVVHPPAMYLAEPMASRGKEAAVFLQEKLNEAKDDQTIRDVVLVLTEMGRRRTYDIVGDTALMELMTKRVAKIRDTEWRKVSERMIFDLGTVGSELGEDRGPGPGQAPKGHGPR